MGTNSTASMDLGAPTGAGACEPGVIPALSPSPDPREVLRCPHCLLVQYRTLNDLCRRCRLELFPAPAPAPVLEPDGLEPGVETAEATGAPVPDVARAIRLWRQRCGLSQRQLAERMRVPRTYVSKIENDKATPTLTSLQRMAEAMETNIAHLLQPQDEPVAAGPAPLAEEFVQALLPMLPHLSPRNRGRLLEASRALARA